jgi:hypothetical protein
LVLSTLAGQVLGGSATVPFLLDVEVHVRFLVAMPLLIAAELVVHRRMRSVVQVFLERHVIPASAMPRFDAAIASALRLRNSVRAEVLLIAFLGNSYEVVRTMRLAPVTKETILRLVVATLAPIVPLALTMMPLEELLKTLLGVLF